jgi:hypothetical protein
MAKVDKKRLVRELVVICSVALVVFLAGFLPWLAQQPIPGYDPYDKYQKLVEAVEQYDYAQGSSKELEARIGTATASIGSDPVQYFFNMKAKAIYNHGLGFYDLSLEALDEASRFVPNVEERAAIDSLYEDNHKALGD